MPKQLYDIRNYPVRSGTSQPKRNNIVLLGKEVEIDERTIADFMVFTRKFSQYVRFYNQYNAEQGDWGDFLYSDISWHLAVSASDKSSAWEKAWKELMEKVEGPGGVIPNDNDYKKYFTWRFDFLYSLLGRMMEALNYSTVYPPWHDNLQAIFHTSQLNIIVYLMNRYYATASQLCITDAGNFSKDDLALTSKKITDNLLKQSNKEVQEYTTADLGLFDKADFIFGSAASVQDKIAAASEYLDELAYQLINIYDGINNIAEKYLEETLYNYNEHQPHVGLFYGFLQLLQEYRTDINSILLKHLDFYYKQVLQVKEKPYEVDSAFVTFELSKQTNEFFIGTGAKLAAGKDTTGKDIFYKTMQDILVNKASVAEIKSFTLIRPGDNGEDNLRRPMGLFAAENTREQGDKPLLPGHSWQPFPINSTDTPGELSAFIGLSFYSSLLCEAEPDQDRNFEVKISFANKILLTSELTFLRSSIAIKIFTEKDTIQPEVSIIPSGVNGFKISFAVPAKTKISNTNPNASLLIGHQNGVVDVSFMQMVEIFQAAKLQSLDLALVNHSVKVSHVETVAGPTDVSSSFPAFGGVPKIGSYFIIGEPLLKNRKVSFLDLKIEWDANTERGFNMDIKCPGKASIPVSVNNNVPESSFTIINSSDVLFDENPIKISLKLALGHQTYAEDVAKFIAGTSFGATTTVKTKKNVTKVLQKNIDYSRQEINVEINRFPSVPYTPVIKNIWLQCTVIENQLSNSQDQLVYQFPFGYKPVTGFSNVHLLPSIPSEGELYIGFTDLNLSESVNFLVQVEEGSADPALPNPAVVWQYLCNNEWCDFNTSLIHDGTKGLIQSGIISFVSPDIDCTFNTILPQGRFWIKASVPFNQTSAVCKIVDVIAQVVLTCFENAGNDPSYLGSNIPSHTISQLYPKQSAIKKVTQPYPSFGGKKTEAPEHLYIRTSERLRHKGRAISVWDYENIILEAFPDIYKAKVLNHACQLKSDPEKIIAKAGEVLLLLMPYTSAQSSVYRPVVSKSRLTAVYEYILPLCSPFTNLSVTNPFFEEVTITADIVFASFVKDRLYYENQLQEDITRFLSPWAFDNSKEPEFGGTIYKAVVLDFIEGLPYVDFITRLELDHAGSASADVAKAFSPASVLISSPSHNIKGELSTNNISEIKSESVGFC
jgi:hypothetical protein